MRKFELRDPVQPARRDIRAQRTSRTLRLTALAVGIGLCLASAAAHAQDADDEDDATFEQKVIRNLMSGVGATSMSNKGIEYRERSPLVVPPSLNLPPPQAARAEKPAPNWPNDPTVAQRKAEKKAAKQTKPDMFTTNMPVKPSELNAGQGSVPATREATTAQPGAMSARSLSPSDLGFSSSMWSNVFGGGKPDQTTFQGEPSRESLTQPPTGYQTPSPNYAYGNGGKTAAPQKTYNFMDPNSKPTTN